MVVSIRVSQVKHIFQGKSQIPPYSLLSLKKKVISNPNLFECCCGIILQVFSNDGAFKLRFGVRGRSPGQLQRPTGVTVDMNGDIIVADYDNRWVSIFSSDGKFKVRGHQVTLGDWS